MQPDSQGFEPAGALSLARRTPRVVAHSNKLKGPARAGPNPADSTNNKFPDKPFAGCEVDSYCVECGAQQAIPDYLSW